MQCTNENVSVPYPFPKYYSLLGLVVQTLSMKQLKKTQPNKKTSGIVRM